MQSRRARAALLRLGCLSNSEPKRSHQHVRVSRHDPRPPSTQQPQPDQTTGLHPEPTQTRGGVHLYDDGMLSATVAELIDVVDRLDIAVDADDLAAVMRARDTILAKAMESLRAFDELLLYQLTKAA